MYETEEKQKTCILIYVDDQSESAESFAITNPEISIAELKNLSETIGLCVLSVLTFRITSHNSSTFVGKGQADKIAETVAELGTDVVVFNADITPRIQRNLEASWGTCVIDRREVIIQIFADRAQTKEAKLQARLAHLEYSLPRLTRKWSSLSQQRGGQFHSRGAGETKLELERRTLKQQITRLKSELEQVKKQRTVQRSKRKTSDLKTVAIVGYTNSGKSSLLRALSRDDVHVEDKLFATLDSQTHRVYIGNERSVLLTDTVGFVDRLPHDLVDAFKSTLEEARYADLLIIVCDANHPSMVDCFKVTENVLEQLDCQSKKQIVFVN